METMNAKDLPVSRQVGKSLSSDGEARVCRPIVYLSREKRGKGKSFRLSATCVSHYGRDVFFVDGGRGGVRGGTKFCAHAWTFLPVRWWSHHRRTRANYYWFQMTTSALTWSSNARSKCDMHSRVSRMRRFGTRWHFCRKRIREIYTKKL